MFYFVFPTSFAKCDSFIDALRFKPDLIQQFRSLHMRSWTASLERECGGVVHVYGYDAGICDASRVNWVLSKMHDSIHSWARAVSIRAFEYSSIRSHDIIIDC